MPKGLIMILIISMAFGCRETEPRRPINKKKQVFLKESAKRNKSKLNIEQDLFKQVMSIDKNLKFNSTPLGFWYRSEEHTSELQSQD